MPGNSRAGRLWTSPDADVWSAVATAVDVVKRVAPTNLTAMMITTATTEETGPYSVALTPVSSLGR